MNKPIKGTSPLPYILSTLLLATMFFGCAKAHAQTNLTGASGKPDVGNPSLSTFPPFPTNTLDRVSGRTGIGYETGTKLWCVAGEVEYQLQPNFYAGVGGLFDHYGRVAGSVSIGLNGSLVLPKFLGSRTVNLFGGDGVAYDTLKHGMANYFTTGGEVPFKIGRVTVSPGLAIIDLSSRGQIICGGIGATF
jgi:hypothetical protein